MDDTEVIYVSDGDLSCDGGDAILGHPKVHLKLGESGEVDCPYCGRRFKISKDAAKS